MGTLVLAWGLASPATGQAFCLCCPQGYGPWGRGLPEPPLLEERNRAVRLSDSLAQCDRRVTVFISTLKIVGFPREPPVCPAAPHFWPPL